MIDKQKLKAQIVLTGKTMTEVAEALDINVVTLYRKMNGVSDFYRRELLILCDILDIEDPKEVFFDREIT